jgi:aminoglycoside 6'-N-acetyltransferase
MSGRIKLRPATLEDVPLLERWDREPHVISATSDDPNAEEAFGADWREELAMQSEVFQYLIAELDGRPIGAMQIIDPHLEPTHYWGDIEPNLRALDIWIGEASDLGKGYGEQMMREAMARCFSNPGVTAIVIDPLASNTRAHKFYQRLGFEPVGRRMFGADDCLVHRLTRAQWEARFTPDSQYR